MKVVGVHSFLKLWDCRPSPAQLFLLLCLHKDPTYEFLFWVKNLPSLVCPKSVDDKLKCLNYRLWMKTEEGQSMSLSFGQENRYSVLLKTIWILYTLSL